MRSLIAGLLNQVLKSQSPTHRRRTLQRRLQRNEEARLYHWRQRKRLPPRRFEQRTGQTQSNYVAGGAISITGNSTSTLDVIGSQYISRTLQSGGNGNYAVNWTADTTPRLRQLNLVE